MFQRIRALFTFRPMSPLQRRIFRLSAALGTTLTLLVLIADSMGALNGLERWLYDRREKDCQYFRKPPSDQIIHIDLDDRSLEAIGRWPWPRDRVAAILEEINRAGPKAIGVDIVYTDPAVPRLEKLPDGTIRQVDEDKTMSEALARMGNVVIPVSLKPTPSQPLDAIETALRAELMGNLELTDEQVEMKLRIRGFAPDEAKKVVDNQFIATRRQAIYDRIREEVDHEPNLTEPQIAARLLPLEQKRTDDSAEVIHSPLRRLLTEQFTLVQAWESIARFAIPPTPGMPTPMATIPIGLPIASYARAAKACGFPDDNVTESIVRSMPMFLECDNRIFPQWGLAFACVVADADLSKAKIESSRVVIPSAHGDLTIPVRWQYSQTIGRDVPLIADIPWFGTDDWQTMYDWPKHQQVVNHIPIVTVWDILQTRNRIVTNNQMIDSAMQDLLDNGEKRVALDPELWAKMHAALTDPGDAALREKDGAIAIKTAKDSGYLDMAGRSDLKPEEKAQIDFIRRAMHIIDAAVGQNRDLQKQLDQGVRELHSRIAGKGVLIGWAATSATDMVVTPLHARCPGVVVHGVIANAVLTGQWWKTAPSIITALFTAILGLAVSFATGLFKPLYAVIAALFAGLAYLILNGVVFFAWGHWIVGAAAPLVVVAVTWSGCTVARLVAEGIERARKEREVERFRHEMNLAKNVQVALIPKDMPPIDGIEPFGWTRPADETGGDLFDLWTLPDGRLGILVADASGHGLAPAVIVSQVRTLVRALSEIEKHPDGLLARVNARLAQDLEPARFVTAFLGFLNPDGELQWASAGHGPMLFCDCEGGDMQSLDATALPLGIMPDWMGDSVPPLKLEMTGMLIVMSDGIFEAPNATGEQFGVERVLEILKDTCGKSCVEITGKIRDAVTAWQPKDKQADDQTTVIIRRVASGLSVSVVEEQVSQDPANEPAKV